MTAGRNVRMPQFKIGDRVRRNDWSDDEEDGNLVKLGDVGEIIDFYEDRSTYDFCVQFETRGSWWIKAACVEHIEPRTKQTIEKEVIAKIKYLNEKYAKSRTVPTQVVDAKQGEFRESVTGIRCEAPRITPTPVRVHDSYYLDGNAIRSETARLRGVDAIEELNRFGIVTYRFSRVGTE